MLLLKVGLREPELRTKFDRLALLEIAVDEMTNVNWDVPVPPALEAERVTLFVPALAGVPEINPVLGLFVNPAGRLLAPKEVGLFEAMIW